MRIAVLGQGPLYDAVGAALVAHGHDCIRPVGLSQPSDNYRSLQASVAISAGYRQKFTPADWACFPNGILNLHTGYLPWNRGAYPNVWPILDGSPAGVTLHRVDEGIDTGPIIAQREVKVEPWDTAKTLYDKLLEEGVKLVVEEVYKADSYGWPDGLPQVGKGSFHRKAEWRAEQYSLVAREQCGLLAHLRAASFPGYGLRYRQDGKLIEATITLKEVTE